jgi:excisionase family DNA binding protein
MENLLNTQQVQSLLKINRITVYRMLNDGRIKGIKVGQRWRFPESEIQRLLSGGSKSHIHTKETTDTGSFDGTAWSFPTHCVQLMQDLYAGLEKIGVIIVDLNGNPLTEISRPCVFCTLVHSTPTGLDACRDSWRGMFSLPSQPSSKWFTCHAGLHYQKTHIVKNGETIAYLMSGQMFLSPSERQRLVSNSAQIAANYHIDVNDVSDALAEIPILKRAQRTEIDNWSSQFVQAVDSILDERARLTDRLQKIATVLRET